AVFGFCKGGRGPLLRPPEAWFVRLRIRWPRSDVVAVARSPVYTDHDRAAVQSMIVGHLAGWLRRTPDKFLGCKGDCHAPTRTHLAVRRLDRCSHVGTAVVRRGRTGWARTYSRGLTSLWRAPETPAWGTAGRRGDSGHGNFLVDGHDVVMRCPVTRV